MEQKLKKLAGVVGVLIFVLALLTSAEAQIIPPGERVEGWWQVSLFGTSLDQNKERSVVSEDVWVFIQNPTCQDTWCQASLWILKMDKGWIGYGNLSLPSTGRGVWYYLHFDEGRDYYGNIFHFGDEMEGRFTPEKWDCPQNGNCSLISFSNGRIMFRR